MNNNENISKDSFSDDILPLVRLLTEGGIKFFVRRNSDLDAFPEPGLVGRFEILVPIDQNDMTHPETLLNWQRVSVKRGFQSNGEYEILSGYDNKDRAKTAESAFEVIRAKLENPAPTKKSLRNKL